MDQVNRIAALFSGLDRAHGAYDMSASTISANNKIGGRARTVHEPVTLEKWQAHLEGTQGIGIVPVTDEATSHFGAIDIDIYDGSLTHQDLEKECEQIGLPLVVCRTKSGGAHLFLFLKEAVEASLLREQLGQAAVLLGHPGVEIFPKQNNLASKDDSGNWINIPYFGGLTDSPDRLAVINGKDASLAEFLDYAESRAITAKELKALNLEPPADELMDGAPPCLRMLAQQGIGEGKRNDTMFNMGVFARFKFPDDWQDAAMQMNQKYFDPPIKMSEFQTLIKSVDRKDYFYSCDREPIKSYCNKALCRKQPFGIGGGTSMPIVIPDAVQKIKTDPPIWILTVEGYRMECNTDDLLQYRRYQKLLVEGLNLMSGTVKPAEWDKVIGYLLQQVEEIEAPHDASLDGNVLHYLEAFCTNQKAQDRQEIKLGLPWTEGEWTWFMGIKFVEYLKSKRIDMPTQQVWRIVRNLAGGESATLSINNRTERLWRVPVFDEVEQAWEPASPPKDEF